MKPSLVDTRPLNADLHSHSRFSDGTLTPGDVVARAHRNGVELLALTDHDETGGIVEAADVAADLGLDFVAGVEISVSWGAETVHVVGLGIDPAEPHLVAGLASIREGREARARQMGESLARAGIPGAYEGALRHVSNPLLVSRTHFARYLVETGACAAFADVFDHYLVQGKPGFVAHRWASLGEAVRWIVGAGGVAVVAHPGRYKITAAALWSMIGEFRDAGGQAIEVVSGSHTRDDVARFAAMAGEFGLLASRGSDYHGPGESRVELGAADPLPGSVRPVWTHPVLRPERTSRIDKGRRDARARAWRTG